MMISGLFLTRCSDENGPVQQPVPSGPEELRVEVRAPSENTVWRGSQCCDTIRWSGARGDSVYIRIYRDSVLLPNYLDAFTVNDSTYVTSGPVPTAWNTDSTYQVQVLDWKGNVGWSSPFTVRADTNAVVVVTAPTDQTVMTSGGVLDSVFWAIDGLGADSVRIDLYQNGTFVTTVEESTPNDGKYLERPEIDFTWGAGSGYQIRIIDTYGRYGWSDPFVILENDCGELLVTTPGSTSVWKHGQENIQVSWGEFCGDEVKADLYRMGEFVDSISGWVRGKNSYTRERPIPSSWQEGDGYQVRVRDRCDNVGYSYRFEIVSDTMQTIEVELPDVASTWRWGQRWATVRWSGSVGDSVKVLLYKDDLYQEIVQGMSPADSVLRLTDSIPSSWASANDYRVKVVDNKGYYGWSDEFTIDSWPAFSVDDPNESTIWLHGDTSVAVEWDGTADSIMAELYKADSLIDTLLDWQSSSRVFHRDSTVPARWGQGEDYRIRVQGDDGNYGWSDPFSIFADTTAKLSVLHPDSGALWFLEQDSLSVKIRTAVPDSLLGDTLRVDLYRDSMYVTTLVEPVPFDTVLIREQELPSWYNEGANYRVKVVDTRFNFGWSGQFEIRADTTHRMTITEPDTTDFFHVGRGNIPVSWDGSQGDSVAVLLLRRGSLVDTFITWMPDTGSAVRVNPIPVSWGFGAGFRLKTIDNAGSFGITDSFTMWQDSLQRIQVRKPDRNTTWLVGAEGISVSWSGVEADSVRIELYRGSSYLDVVSECAIDSAALCTKDAPVPTYWGSGEDFRVKVIDEHGRYGWSETFSIRDEF